MKRTEAGDIAPVRVWDIPTRLFHWALVALIAFSWWSGEEELTGWHMWSGYAVLALLVFRIVWGFVGSSTARFANFVTGPRTIAGYLRNVKGWAGVGHNPLGALSLVAILVILAVQVTTGLFQTDDDGLVEGPLAPLVGYDLAEAAHDLHETSFDVLLVLIGIHVAAILGYRLFLGKDLVGPMLSGRARLRAGIEPLRPAKPWAVLVSVLLAAALTAWIVNGLPLP